LKPFLRKLRYPSVWKRLLVDRGGEPLHLNALATGVALFGSFRARVAFDLVPRPHHAYGLLEAADRAQLRGIQRISALELGVAAGTGLLNMAEIASRVRAATGVEIDVVGFDTGDGMPPTQDWRDHPDLYQEGDFPMDRSQLRAFLDRNGGRLVLGELGTELARFLSNQASQSPVGFISLDLDYYSSSAAALACFARCDPSWLLPHVVVYVDDIELPSHSSAAGELAAIASFNRERRAEAAGHAHPFRFIERPQMLRRDRIFQRARWVDHIFTLHVHDHPMRSDLTLRREKGEAVLENPYLGPLTAPDAKAR
jgi:hypothetical protein